MSSDPYAAIADIYDHWCAEVVEDLPFYLGACEGATAPIVEIGAGTGRIAIPLALRGHRVIGIDRSEPMLDGLRANVARAGVADRVRAVAGDLRALPALEPTDRMIAPFRVLLHLVDDDERLAFLIAARELLVPGGQLVFDVFEPTRADVRVTQGRELERDSGVRETADWDVARGLLGLTVRFRGRETTMQLHYIAGRRWAELLSEAGFASVSGYEGFTGVPFSGRRGDSAWIATA